MSIYTLIDGTSSSYPFPYGGQSKNHSGPLSDL